MKKLLVLVLAAALSFASCKKSLNDDSASVLCTTQGVANVTAISATLIGSAYIENASEAMSQFCFYYSDTESDSASLKRNGLKVFAGKTTGPADTTFKYELTDLKPETKYYFLASATSGSREDAGLVKFFTTKSGGPTSVPVTGITLDRGLLSLRTGSLYKLTATVSPVNATDKQVSWSTDDSSILYVDTDGTIAGLKTGKAYVTATTNDGHFTASCEVVVSASTINFVDLGLSVKWADCNLGANSPEEYGDYYAWGETETYYEDGDAQSGSPRWKSGKENGYIWSNYLFRTAGTTNADVVFFKYNGDPMRGVVDNKKVLDLRDDVAHTRFGGNCRIPTIEEWNELLDNCIWTWTVERTADGRVVRGYKVASRVEGYWKNSIFLPAAGVRQGNSGPDDMAKYGYYWSSSLYENSYSAYRMGFFEKSKYPDDFKKENYEKRCLGYTIRPVWGED